MGGNTETFNVVISGISNVSGDYGFTPTAGSPTCRDFVIPAASIEADLSDGDIDISYGDFGSGWTIPDTTGGADDFNAQVISATFEYDIPTTISSFTDRCQDGTDVTFSGTPVGGSATGDSFSFEIFPSTAGFNTTTGLLDVSATEAGQYVVRYTYSLDGCESITDSDIQIFPTPVATIDDAVLDCGASGLTLTTLFSDSTTENGTFTTSTPDASISGNSLSFDGYGCVDITYTVDNENGCLDTPYEDIATIFIPESPSPSFQITSSTSCWDGVDPLAITIDRLSPDYTQTESITWTATGTNLNVSLSNTTADVPTISVTPNGSELGSIRICLEESITTPGSTCADDVPCTQIVCNELTISSVGCNLDCFEFDPPAEVCPQRVNSSFAFSIFGITFDFGGLTGFDLFEASVVPGDFLVPDQPSMGGDRRRNPEL